MNLNFDLQQGLQGRGNKKPGIAARLRRIHPWAPLGAILLGLALLALAAYYAAQLLFPATPRRPPPPPVKVATVMRKNVSVLEHTIGTIVSPATVQVTAQVTGKLLGAPFTEGQMVHKGDLLFQIDPAPYEAALAQAQGQLARDNATLANARVDLARYQALAQQNAISNQQLLTQAAAVKSDEGVVVTDAANVQAARINVGYARIVSPIDGKTGPLLIQPGNLISANQSNPLVVITQVAPIMLSFTLPQNDLAQIQQQMAKGRLEAIIPMTGAPGGVERAKVDFISNIVAAATGTIELRATFPNTDGLLVPGQSVNVDATLRDLAGVLVVPRDAVNAGPDSDYVYVVGKDHVAVSKTVTLLNDDGNLDAIEGGLKPGDKVVTEGQMRVVSGAPVCVGKCGRGAPQAGANP